MHDADAVFLAVANCRGGFGALLHPNPGDPRLHYLTNDLLGLRRGNNEHDAADFLWQFQHAWRTRLAFDCLRLGMYRVHPIALCAQILEDNIAKPFSASGNPHEREIPL